MFRTTCVAGAAALLFSAGLAHAGQASDTDARGMGGELVDTASVPVRAGERLSEWLTRAAGQAPDTTALHWRVESEKMAQRALRDAALWQLSSGELFNSLAPFRDAVSALPLTGRMPLYVTQPLALAALPEKDPVLKDGESVVLFKRPRFVNVLLSSGELCLVPHVAGLLAMDYVNACNGESMRFQVDRVWLSQADEHNFDFGVAAWNHEPQPRIAPGAWLWAPLRRHNIAPEVSSNLIRFLGTQPPLEHMKQSALSRLAREVSRPAAQEHAAPAGAQLSSSDWGEMGLLQTPSARVAPVGDARFVLSRVNPYIRGNFVFQPLDWFGFGFRYTNVSNVLYGPVSLSGNQAYKDKSIDAKFHLAKESFWMPELALGLHDLTGTGLFSGEYVVASKRWGDFDASLGLGWGYVGGRGNLRNPLASVLGSQWNTRTQTTVGTGKFDPGVLFHGPTALFGGVQYSLSQQILLKAELDGNNYQHEPFADNQPVRSRFNFGMVYRQSPSVDWSVGLERGNTLMAGVTLHTDATGLGGLSAPKLLDPPKPPLQAPAAVKEVQMPLGDLLKYLSEQTGWQVRIVNLDRDTATIVAEASTAIYIQDRVDKAVRALNAQLPAQYRHFVIELRELAMPLTTVTVDREEWVAKRIQPQPPSQQLPDQQLHPENKGFKTFDDVAVDFKNLSFSASPSYSQIIGGPNGFVLFAAGLNGSMDYRFNKNTWVFGNINLRGVDNFDKFTYDAPSSLPRVRTYVREYETTSRVTMPILQATHVMDFGGGQYGMLYGGMLEMMFGGVGGEWLYRPWMSRWSVGVNVNHVEQRDFQQKFGFRNYSVNTGHASLYWDTGFQNIQATLSAGKYLAGDVGATVDLKRVFDNGVAIGAWVTKTNVSSATYGEGSFDKGVYITIPFDAMLPRSSGGSVNLTWQPLLRDGGARLSRKYTLDDLTRVRNPDLWTFKPYSPPEWFGAENLSRIETTAKPHPLGNLGDTTRTLGQQIVDIPASSWLVAGSAVLGSSLLDNKVNNWAQHHSTGKWSKLGTLGADMPYVLAGGVGALWLGLGGQDLATTAGTAILSGAYAIGINTGVRYAVGRARPTQGEGDSSFNGFSRSAFQSSFPSNHTAGAFALVTPFAQQYDQPWLYGLAAAVGYGRIQKRDHWLSDTVGGALAGYATGSMLTLQQQQRRSDKPGLSLAVTPNSIAANWKY